MSSVFLVEDEAKVAGFIEQGLREAGYQVLIARSGEAAAELMQESSPDLFILDVMLPGMSGLDLCQHIRRTDTTTPVLMLTALGMTSDKVTALRAGADDYLVKP